MEGDRICERCGQVIPRGTEECPNCAHPQRLRLRRDTFLLVCLLLLGILFAITGFAVKLYHNREKALGGHWYTKGEQSLQHGNPEGAMLDFRTALFHAPDNPVYQLRLAQALVHSNRLVEARSYLLRLWETNPADGQVNLELARVAMRQGNVPQVITCYHNAIDGVWPTPSEGQRRKLREELCEYLISQNRRTEALAELMALSAETPNNARLRTQVADLFLNAQDYDIALNQFRRSLRLNRRQPKAWQGAGEAAFQMGDYRAARDYLSRAHSEEPRNKDVAARLSTADRVLEMDPFDRRVPAAERRRRVVADFELALARIESCAKSRGETLQVPTPQTDLEKAYASALKMKPKVRDRTLRLHPDLADVIMNFIFQVEQMTAQDCGAPQGADLALLLIASKSGGED
ncbi:MAG: tetratricopeptide repeat protein [Terriglobia bacterium]